MHVSSFFYHQSYSQFSLLFNSIVDAFWHGTEAQKVWNNLLILKWVPRFYFGIGSHWVYFFFSKLWPFNFRHDFDSEMVNGSRPIWKNILIVSMTSYCSRDIERDTMHINWVLCFPDRWQERKKKSGYTA